MAATTIASTAVITAIAAVDLRLQPHRRSDSIFRPMTMRIPRRAEDRHAPSATAPKPARPAPRPCVAAIQAMARIWIAMGMGWGVSRGGGDTENIENCLLGVCSK